MVSTFKLGTNSKLVPLQIGSAGGVLRRTGLGGTVTFNVFVIELQLFELAVTKKFKTTSVSKSWLKAPLIIFVPEVPGVAVTPCG